MKWTIILLIVSILFCGCASVEPTVSVTTVPTPVTVTPTYLPTNTPIETPGPTPTPNYDICFDKNITTPDYCYDRYYWVRPTTTPAGMGYTARVWKNTGCVNLNRSSGECEGWGDNSFTVLFLHNLTVVRNITGVNLTEVISAINYYNTTYDLNKINSDDFSEFIRKFWDGTYPSVKYDYSLFAPDPKAVIVPIDTFNPNGF